MSILLASTRRAERPQDWHRDGDGLERAHLQFTQTRASHEEEVHIMGKSLEPARHQLPGKAAAFAYCTIDQSV